MGDEMNMFTGRAILINKKNGEVVRLGDVTIKEASLGELEPGDEHIELRRPSFIGGDKITFSVKIRSKRKWRKMLYPFFRPIHTNRLYISKREMIRAIHKISEEAKVGHITESDEQLMRYSAKHLLAIANRLYGMIQSNA